MNHQQSRVDISTNKKSRVDKYEKFAWQFENFSRLKYTDRLYTEPFVLGGYPWKISLFQQGKLLSIVLEAVKTANMSKGWSRDVKFRLTVYNQFDSKMTITKDADHEFKEKSKDWGCKSFMPSAEFNDPKKGFLVKDACIIGVEVSVCKARNEKQVSQEAGLTASLTSRGQTGHTILEVPKPEPESEGPDLETLLPPAPTLVSIDPTKQSGVELFSASIGELIDFRGLGQIEKPFVPLLEEVCSHHPSLIECQLKRSRKFSGWAFNALGRVLYFLKTKKLKDMNDVCRNDLQTLWEELKAFGFDLTWLKPHVETTLGMKSYVEKAMRVEKLKEIVVALELETEKLKAKLATAMAILELETEKLDAERDLLKGKGLQVKDLDAELGYGSWEANGI